MSRHDLAARRGRSGRAGPSRRVVGGGRAGHRSRPASRAARSLLAPPLALAALAGGALAALAGAARPAAASPPASPETPGWCAEHGASLAGWTGTVPDLPICGSGPAYGGSGYLVDLPGPGGTTAGYYGATPGFQCVELAERFLAVVYGLAPVEANGESVAAHYHAAYPWTALYVGGTAAAVGHPPEPGDVLSVSADPSFEGPVDGHVAVVVSTRVDAATGDGSIVVAQENVSSSDYRKTIDLVDWRLVDPAEPADPLFQFPYAEWLHVGTMPYLAAREAAELRRQGRAGTTLRYAHAGGEGERLAASGSTIAAVDRSPLAGAEASGFVSASAPVVVGDLRLVARRGSAAER